MSHALILLAALALDALFGEPKALWERVPHPAVLMGRAVGWADARFNDGTVRTGLAVWAVLAFAAWIIGVLVAALPLGPLWEALAAGALLAQRSLAEHVRAVADALRLSVADARLSVARIVGRDTAGLDGPAVARAAIESAAENFSDGVVAPAFWFLLAGLPGLMVYKLTNTADSMIGYRTERHEAFGKAAARADDALNWIPARLSAVLILATHGAHPAWHAVRRDAPLHVSPNAGWPEAAMAQVLGVALAGPRAYGGEMRDLAWVNGTGERAPGAGDLDRAVGVMWRSWAGLSAIVALIALFPVA